MAKYKINQCVKLVFQPDVHVFQIFEIVETTCSEGTQISYRGRVNGVNAEGLAYHSPKELAVREAEIINVANQSDVWEEMSRIRAEKKKDSPRQ